MSEHETTALVIIPPQSISTVLAADKDDLLGSLAAEIKAFNADVTTEKGRREIASMARKVASTKIKLTDLGKALTDGWREQTRAVMDECKIIVARMDELRDQVRAPLNAFDERERLRVLNHQMAVDAMTVPDNIQRLSSREIGEWLDRYTMPQRDWEEFAQKATDAHEKGIKLLRIWYAEARTREDEAEAAALAIKEAREKAEREQIEREVRIAEESAAKAKAEAEAHAARQIEQERQAKQLAIARANAARVKAHQWELDALVKLGKPTMGTIPDPVAVIEAKLAQLDVTYSRDWEEFAEAATEARTASVSALTAARVAALEFDRKMAADRLEAQRKAEEAAVQAERDRQEAADRAVREHQAKRAADVEHRRRVNNEAAFDLAVAMDGKPADATPREMIQILVAAIARGEVRHVKLEY